MTVSNGQFLSAAEYRDLPIDNYAEPGFYADGRFGIRIENIVVVREVKTPNNFGNKGFLGFEALTMVRPLHSPGSFTDSLPSMFPQCPIHKNLVDNSLLTGSERSWLNQYHATVLNKVSPLLQNDPRALAWLQRECLPL